MKGYSDILLAQAGCKLGPHSEKNNKKRKNVIRQMHAAERISEYPLCLFMQGSMTIEAALILPLFWCFFAGFLYLLLLFRLQEDISQSLADAGRELGQYAYVAENGNAEDMDRGFMGLSLLQVKQKLESQCKDKAALQLVEGKLAGIHLKKSKLMEQDGVLELIAEYKLRLPWILLGMKPIPIIQRQVCRAWIGGPVKTGENGRDETMIYITPYGEVYHTSMECRHLHLSLQIVSQSEIGQLRNLNGERYQACESCDRYTSGGVVYVTDYGNRFHQDLNCPGLKRTVYLLLASEAEGRKICESCKRNEN